MTSIDSTPGEGGRDDARERESLFLPVMRHVNEITLSPDDESSAPVVDEIESLCMNCHENVGGRIY